MEIRLTVTLSVIFFWNARIWLTVYQTCKIIQLVKVPSRVHYVKYCTRAWTRGKYSTRWSRVLYLASRPRPSAIFHVVHEGIRYFNWFIVFHVWILCWSLERNGVFWLTDRSTIDVESMVSCYSQCMPSFVAFPSVCTLQAYRSVHQIAQLGSRLYWYHGS